MSSKGKAKASTVSTTPSSRVCMGNPLLNERTFKFPEEEHVLSTILPRMLKDVFPFKVKINRNKIEDFFKLRKKERKDALKREALRLRRQTQCEPKLVHLRAHVCVGLGQAMRLFQRGELGLLLLDQDNQAGLDAALAAAKGSSDCAIMAMEGLGKNICQGAIGYPSSAVGFRRTIADVKEFEAVENIVTRLNSSSPISRNRQNHYSNIEAEESHHNSKNASPPAAVEPVVKDVLLRREDKSSRVFRPSMAKKIAEKEDAGQDFISFQPGVERMAKKKRKSEATVEFEKAKLMVTPSAKKKKTAE